jgi:putative tricarboxylic transport membrane protein
MTRVANRGQVAVGLAIVGLGAGMGFGASAIPSEAGYAGIGPNFLPWVVSIALFLFGILLIREAFTGGFRQLEVDASEPPFATGFGWISFGLIFNAVLMTRIGFVLGCGLCFMFAVQGLRQSQQTSNSDVQPISVRVTEFAKDFLIGLAISAPVFWMFTKLLGIKLPGLTDTGWI